MFFLKGIFQSQRPYGSTSAGAAANAGAGPKSRLESTPPVRLRRGFQFRRGSAKVKHNRIYTAAEIIQKFGNPSSRSSKATAEEWVYKCKDGVVHVHFTQVGYAYARSSSASKSETLRLEIKSVDSTSSPSGGNSRF